MPRRAGLESSRQVRKARKVLITAKVGRALRASRRTAGRMAGCPVVPMNDDPMKTARGCHPNIIQLDNRVSEQRDTLLQVCKCVNVLTACLHSRGRNGWRSWSVPTICPLGFPCPRRYRRAHASCRPRSSRDSSRRPARRSRRLKLRCGPNQRRRQSS